MSDRKFTDDEVIKALERCNDNGGCDNCPFDGAYNEDELWCVDELNKATRTLINRQKAEIEAMKIANEKMYAASKEIAPEAIKEFAERLKECAYDLRHYDGTKVPVVETHCIDNLVKEMTEGEKQ